MEAYDSQALHAIATQAKKQTKALERIAKALDAIVLLQPNPPVEVFHGEHETIERTVTRPEAHPMSGLTNAQRTVLSEMEQLGLTKNPAGDDSDPHLGAS